MLPQEPLETLEIKFKSGEIASFSEENRKTRRRHAIIFTADENWLEGLTGRFKNVSTKPITRIQFKLTIPDTYNPKHSLHSTNPFLAAKLSLAPGNEITLRFNDKSFRNLIGRVRQLELTVLKIVELQLDFVEFDDGTAWRLGKFMHKDPNDPRHWIVTDRVTHLFQRIKAPKFSYAPVRMGDERHRLQRYSRAFFSELTTLKSLSNGDFSIALLTLPLSTKSEPASRPKRNSKTTLRTSAAYDCADLGGTTEYDCGAYPIPGQGFITCYVFDDELYYNPTGEHYTDETTADCSYDGDCCSYQGGFCWETVTVGAYPSQCAGSCLPEPCPPDKYWCEWLCQCTSNELSCP